MDNRLNFSATTLLALCVFILCLGCNEPDDDTIINPPTPGIPILEQLSTNYTQLPEQAIARSADGQVYAQYAQPTSKYSHGILGDAIEAEQLIVVIDSVFYQLTLPDEYVFEDIQPRLFDVDNDGFLEFITIRTHIDLGGGIMIYKLMGGELKEYASVTEIGTRFRWLNIVGINDLDQNGTIELLWIQTPHIGGILKVATFTPGNLSVIDEKSQYSNHAIGQTNLCLSVLTTQDNEKVVYVPSQDRNQIVGFKFNNQTLELVEEIDQTVDFSVPLFSQFDFQNIIEEEENNCIL